MCLTAFVAAVPLSQTPAPCVDVTAEPLKKRLTHATGKIAVTWEDIAYTGDKATDVVDTYTVSSDPDIGTIAVPASNVKRVVFEGATFEVSYTFTVVASGCDLQSLPVSSKACVVYSHIGAWLRRVHLFDEAYGPVLTWLDARRGKDFTLNISAFVKTCKELDVPDVPLARDGDLVARFTKALDDETRRVLYFEGEPWRIREADVLPLTWKGTTRTGRWKDYIITLLKSGKNARSSSRIEELMRDAIMLTDLEHDGLVPVLGYALEPFNALVFELPQSQTLEQWLQTQPHVDDIRDSGARNFAIAVRARIVEEVALTLQFLHNNGVVHGEVRASCVYLRSRKGGLVVAQLSAYGLVRTQARWDSDREPMLENAMPSVHTDTVPPNQWSKPLEVAPATDSYGLGILLTEVMCGARGLTWANCPHASKRAFLYRSWVAQQAVAGKRPVGATSLPASVKVLLKSLTAQQPYDRITIDAFLEEFTPTCRDVFDMYHLSAFVLEPPTPAPTPEATPRSVRGSGDRPG